MFIRQFHLLTELYKVTIPGFGFLHHVTSLIWTRGNYVKTQQTTCARFNIFLYSLSINHMYTKTDYTRTKYGQYKDDNSKTLTMPTYYITLDIQLEIGRSN